MTIFKRLSAQKPPSDDSPPSSNSSTTLEIGDTQQSGAIRVQLERDLRKKLEPVELDHGYYDDTDTGSKSPPTSRK